MAIMVERDGIWDDEDALVVAEQPPIAVLINRAGDVVIRQLEGDEDVYVRVRPEQAPVLARALLIEVGLEGWLAPGFPRGPFLAPEFDPIGRDAPPAPPARKDPTAAERQRPRRAAQRDRGEDVTVEHRDGERDNRDGDGGLFHGEQRGDG